MLRRRFLKLLTFAPAVAAGLRVTWLRQQDPPGVCWHDWHAGGLYCRKCGKLLFDDPVEQEAGVRRQDLKTFNARLVAKSDFSYLTSNTEWRLIR